MWTFTNIDHKRKFKVLVEYYQYLVRIINHCYHLKVQRIVLNCFKTEDNQPLMKEDKLFSFFTWLRYFTRKFMFKSNSTCHVFFVVSFLLKLKYHLHFVFVIFISFKFCNELKEKKFLPFVVTKMSWNYHILLQLVFHNITHCKGKKIHETTYLAVKHSQIWLWTDNMKGFDRYDGKKEKIIKAAYFLLTSSFVWFERKK